MTSEATVPDGGAGAGADRAKTAGVVFGLDVVAEAMRQCGVEHVDKLVVEGQWREEVPAEVALASGPARGAAGRRAHRAQLPRPPLRHRHPHRPLRRGGGRHRRPHPRHPQDDAWAARLEKAAVAAGGGVNHRMGLYDAILIKENHIALAGGVAKAVYAARKAQPELRDRGRGRDLDEAAYALGTGADRLLLDNMDPETLREAVKLRDENAGGRTARSLEASGGVDLDTVREIAETGVDFISDRRAHPLGADRSTSRCLLVELGAERAT